METSRCESADHKSQSKNPGSCMISRRTNPFKKDVTVANMLCEVHLIQPEGSIRGRAPEILYFSCLSQIFKVLICIFSIVGCEFVLQHNVIVKMVHTVKLSTRRQGRIVDFIHLFIFVGGVGVVQKTVN